MENYTLFSFLLTFVYLVFGLFTSKKEKSNFITTGIIAIIFFLIVRGLCWACLPIISFGFGTWIYFLLLLAIVVWIDVAIKDCVNLNALIASLPSFGVLIALISLIFTTSECSNASRYHKLLDIESVADSSFNNNVHPISIEKMITVDEAMARKIVTEKMEQIPSMGSRVEIGEMSIQMITGSFEITEGDGKKTQLSFDNDLIWVAPLEHSGFWKWNKFETTPGYVLVSATDQNKYYFITEVNGKKLDLKYLESSCFSTNIERHLRSNGFASKGLTDYSFEIDDNGIPYAAVTIYENTIGYSGKKAIGIALVDIQTGDIKEYNIENTPDWVDRIQPMDYINDYIGFWGEYVNGWYNPSNEGRQKSTPGTTLVFSNGRCYWYTGIQSYGSDDATSGFMLVDTRTAKATYYPISGVNEVSAANYIQTIEWIAQTKGQYYTNDAVLYNIKGIPTYYCIVKGSSGLAVGYGLCSVSNKIFAAGKTLQEAVSNYIQAHLSANSHKALQDGTAKKIVMKLKISNIVAEGSTYYILFEELKGKEFYLKTETFPEVKWSKIGDVISFSYTESKEQQVPISKFDNLNFEF